MSTKYWWFPVITISGAACVDHPIHWFNTKYALFTKSESTKWGCLWFLLLCYHILWVCVCMSVWGFVFVCVCLWAFVFVCAYLCVWIVTCWCLFIFSCLIFLFISAGMRSSNLLNVSLSFSFSPLSLSLPLSLPSLALSFSISLPPSLPLSKRGLPS